MSHVVVAAICGNAGAGGAILALAADRVFARDGVVLNPHYKAWAGSMARNIGPMCCRGASAQTRAQEIMAGLPADGNGRGEGDRLRRRRLRRRPRKLSSRNVDRAGGGNRAAARFLVVLRDKHEKRVRDEREKPLAAYRAEELARMKVNFFGPDPAYHRAREKFVFKGHTPRPRPAGAARLPIAI